MRQVVGSGNNLLNKSYSQTKTHPSSIGLNLTAFYIGELTRLQVPHAIAGVELYTPSKFYAKRSTRLRDRFTHIKHASEACTTK